MFLFFQGIKKIGHEKKMSHIELNMENKCYYYLSVGKTASSSQLFNVLIHNRTIRSNEYCVVTYETETNTFFVMFHNSNPNLLRDVPTVPQLIQKYQEFYATPLYVCHVEDQSNGPLHGTLHTYDHLELRSNEQAQLGELKKKLLLWLANSTQSQHPPRITLVVTSKPLFTETKVDS